MNYLRKVMSNILDILEEFGRARTASALAREGHFELAQKLISNK